MDVKRAHEIFSHCLGKRVLVIGDIMLDTYIEGTVDRLNPELPAAPLLTIRSERHSTGGAGNIAKNLTALGGEVVLYGIIGHDAAGSAVEVAAAEEGYSANLYRAARCTVVKTRYLCGGRQLMRVDRDNLEEFSSKNEERLLERVKTLLPRFDAVFISDYAKGMITQSVASQVIRMCEEAGKISFVDGKPGLGEALCGADFISPNLGEGRQFLGTRPDDTDLGPSGVAHLLQEKFNTNVFLTLGADGMRVCRRGSVSDLVLQTHRVAVADTSGCGDTAAAMILLATLAGATNREAAELANAAGAVVASQVGAASPRRPFLLTYKKQLGATRLSSRGPLFVCLVAKQTGNTKLIVEEEQTKE